MAETRLHLVPFPAPGRKRRNQTRKILDAHEILADVLDVIRNVQDTLAAYQMMLTATEAAAIRLPDQGKSRLRIATGLRGCALAAHLPRSASREVACAECSGHLPKSGI